MATFTPPSHTEYFAPVSEDRLWGRVSYQRAHAVLIDADGNVTPYPGLQVVDSDLLVASQTNGSAFLDSETTVGPGEMAALIGAGYADTIVVAPDETAPSVATTISAVAKAVVLANG